jgi:hypothetical protein
MVAKLSPRCLAALLMVSCSRSSPEAGPAAPEGKTASTPRQPSQEELGVPPNALPKGMVMHRLGAGDPDASGWYLATSTEGGFSVSLPKVFNDFTMTSKAVDGVEIKIHAVGTLDARGVKFSAMVVRRADGKFKDDPLEGQAAGFEKQGSLKQKRAVALGAMKGIELRVANDSSTAVIRLYTAPTMLYQLIVEAPASLGPEEVEADEKRFLESLDVPDRTPEG